MMKSILAALAFVLTASAIAIGAATFGAESPPAAPRKATTRQKLYTCPMHPQIRWTKPDACPICGMKLTATKMTKPAPNKQAGPHDEMPMDRDSMAMPGHAGMSMDHGRMHHMMCGCGMCMQMMGMGSMNHGPAPAAATAAASRGYIRGGMRGGRRCGC